jgi:TldD protein
MQKITMIGNDMKLDPGIGVCGKEGQSVPVGVGQPSMMISSMTIGGTEI